MSKLQISNNGEIDPMAFELIGASTKRGDSTKIGQFGSGLKYSIAWLLRNEIEFTVFSGKEEVKFTKKVEQFRGQVFERILINGKETSYTTDMGGVDWETWMIIREIWCNAIDEGGEEMQVSEVEFLSEGKTTFNIQITPSIQQVVDDWDFYFSNNRKDIVEQVGAVKVFNGGEDLIIYRRGVRCYFKKGERCAFHYDLPEVAINESRIANDIWTLEYDLTKWWTTQATKEIIKRLLRDITGKYEFFLKWDMLNYNIKDAWKEAIGDRYVVESEFAGNFENLVTLNKPLVLPANLTKSLTTTFKGHVKHVGGEEGEEGMIKKPFTEKMDFMLKKAEEFCSECEYPITYPIQLVQFRRKGVMGQAANGKIYVASEAFESLGLLVKILIEENEHLLTGHEDETRAFQDHFLTLFLQEKMKRFTYSL